MSVFLTLLLDLHVSLPYIGVMEAGSSPAARKATPSRRVNAVDA